MIGLSLGQLTNDKEWVEEGPSIDETLRYCETVLDKKVDTSIGENLCWITDGYPDRSCEEYCWDCANKIVEEEIPVVKSINRQLKKRGSEPLPLPQVDGGGMGMVRRRVQNIVKNVAH